MTNLANPYAATDASLRAPIAPSGPLVTGVGPAYRHKRTWGRAAASLGLSLAFGAATFGALSVMHSAVIVVGVVGFGAATASAALGVWFSGVTIVRASQSPPRAALVLAGLTLLALNAAMALLGALLALMSTATFSRGRQLRRFGRVLLPQLRAGGSWSSTMDRLELDGRVPSEVAAQWRENARTEHASVAAFARLTLDLLALGAPPNLIEAAHRDGLDEIRHTQLCLSLSAAMDGNLESPTAFPEAQRARTRPRARSLALATLAVDSLVDGALHEGVSARVIARLAKIATLPSIRDTLSKIAADEGRHSAHGWDVVQWCVSEGGVPILSALEAAARALPKTMQSPLPAGAEDGSWEPWGIHGRAMEAEEYAKARAHVVQRVRAMTLAMGSPAHQAA